MGAIRLAELASGAAGSRLRLLITPVAAIAVPLTLAWATSPYKEWTLWGNYPRFLGLVPYLATLLFGVLLADALGDSTRALAWALVGSASLAAAYALIQVGGLDPFEWFSRDALARGAATSTLGNPNFPGGFLGIALPVAAGLALTDVSRRKLALVGLGVIAAGWIAARSEGGWAAGLTGLVLVGGHALRHRSRWTIQAGLALAAALFIAVVGSVVAGIVVDDAEALPTTIERRGDWWEGGVAMAADSPVIGRGPGTYALEGTKYRTAEDARGVGFDFTDDPHSVFVWFLTSAGVIGLVGVIIAFGWVVRQGVLLRPGDLMGAAFFGAAAAYIVQASISIETIALRGTFWTVVAGLVVARASEQRTISESKVHASTTTGSGTLLRTGTYVAAGGLAILGLFWAGSFLVADARFQHATDLMEMGRGDEAIAQFDRAIAFRDEPFYRRVFGRELGDIAASFAATGERDVADFLFRRADDALSYSHYLPHANSVVDHARVLTAWSEIDANVRERAVAAYERALKLDPLNPQLQAEVTAAL